MTDMLHKYMSLLMINTEIADVNHFFRGIISFWANDFRDKNGRWPNREEADEEIKRLEEKRDKLT